MELLQELADELEKLHWTPGCKSSNSHSSQIYRGAGWWTETEGRDPLTSQVSLEPCVVGPADLPSFARTLCTGAR